MTGEAWDTEFIEGLKGDVQQSELRGRSVRVADPRPVGSRPAPEYEFQRHIVSATVLVNLKFPIISSEIQFCESHLSSQYSHER